MPVVTEAGVLQFDNKARVVTGKRVATSRKRKAAPKLSKEEREHRQQERNAHKAKLQSCIADVHEIISRLMECLHDEFPEHSPGYYHQFVMQQPKLPNEKKITQWMAFTSLEAVKDNNAQEADGGEHQRVSGLSKLLSERWNTLSEEEKDALTTDRMKELEERRKDKKHGVRNVALSAFQDMHITMTKVYEEVRSNTDRPVSDP
ncbi:hypothetical protein C8Q80DRAFT_1269725 [Daedaleopsis nitida]|nr:hypothetical protein C8Q80DRAFT_1269725 [Daedaleopsis nitida]